MSIQVESLRVSLRACKTSTLPAAKDTAFLHVYMFVPPCKGTRAVLRDVHIEFVTSHIELI